MDELVLLDDASNFIHLCFLNKVNWFYDKQKDTLDIKCLFLMFNKININSS